MDGDTMYLEVDAHLDEDGELGAAKAGGAAYAVEVLSRYPKSIYADVDTDQEYDAAIRFASDRADHGPPINVGHLDPPSTPDEAPLTYETLREALTQQNLLEYARANDPAKTAGYTDDPVNSPLAFYLARVFPGRDLAVDDARVYDWDATVGLPPWASRFALYLRTTATPDTEVTYNQLEAALVDAPPAEAASEGDPPC